MMEEEWVLLHTLCVQRIRWFESRIAKYESWEQASRPIPMLESYKRALACYYELKKFVEDR